MTNLSIEIDVNSWQSVDMTLVKTTLYEAANCIYRNLKGMPPYRIVVEHSFQGSPMTYYRRSNEDFHRVKLTNSPLDYSSQITYQFAHEFTHIVSDHNRLQSTTSRNGWFHESLCELGSIFVMHQSKNVDYVTYVDQECLSRAKDSLSRIDRDGFGTWLLDREDLLRETNAKIGYCRTFNAVIAYRLHYIFKEHPEIWNVVRFLPKSDNVILEYLKEWQASVSSDQRHLVDYVSMNLLA